MLRVMETRSVGAIEASGQGAGDAERVGRERLGHSPALSPTETRSACNSSSTTPSSQTMKRLFGRDKPKIVKTPSGTSDVGSEVCLPSRGHSSPCHLPFCPRTHNNTSTATAPTTSTPSNHKTGCTVKIGCTPSLTNRQMSIGISSPPMTVRITLHTCRVPLISLQATPPSPAPTSREPHRRSAGTSPTARAYPTAIATAARSARNRQTLPQL